MSYDEEDFINDIEAKLKGKLNEFIDKVNVEKKDTLIKKIKSENSYFLNSLPKTINNSVYVIYGISDQVANDSAGGNTIDSLSVDIEIAVFDKGEAKAENAYKKCLRYRKAVKELFKGFKTSIGRNVEKEILIPALINDKNLRFFTSGVKLTTIIEG